MTAPYDLVVRAADGRAVPLADQRGRVLLIVNTASRCGFTGQYAGLEALHRDYGPRGLSVLGFPCNQFGGQEPGEADEIAAFCATTFNVTFPILAKVEVNGPDAEPVFAWAKARAPGLLGSRAVKWNFTKFLVSPDGTKVERFAPATAPEALRQAIERMLPAAGR